MVLDTSAILSRIINLADPRVVVPESVLDEIKLGRIARITEYLDQELDVRIPTEKSKALVREASSTTGDMGELSQTDMDVVAVALDVDGTVVTDDYAIQNVCGKLGVKFTGAGIRRINKDIRWQYRCTGCGRTIASFTERCSVCGHQVKRTVRYYKVMK